MNKFEDSIIGDFLSDIHEIYDYLTEICVLGREYSLSIWNTFQNGSFDKPLVDDSILHLPRPKYSRCSQIIFTSSLLQ